MGRWWNILATGSHDGRKRWRHLPVWKKVQCPPSFLTTAIVQFKATSTRTHSKLKALQGLMLAPLKNSAGGRQLFEVSNWLTVSNYTTFGYSPSNCRLDAHFYSHCVNLKGVPSQAFDGRVNCHQSGCQKAAQGSRQSLTG